MLFFWDIDVVDAFGPLLTSKSRPVQRGHEGNKQFKPCISKVVYVIDVLRTEKPIPQPAGRFMPQVLNLEGKV